MNADKKRGLKRVNSRHPERSEGPGALSGSRGRKAEFFAALRMTAIPAHLRSSAFICGLILLSGCTSDSIVKVGQRSTLDSVDLTAMTDDMAMKIAGDVDVINEFNAHGPLRVVVQPVENRLTGEVLPRGQAEVFTARVRQLLSKHAPERFTWIMNRDSFYRLRSRELEAIDLGPAPEAMNPKFELKAIFSSILNEDQKKRSSYYLCVYELTNLETRSLLWSGRYEVKKVAVKSEFD
jgi:hypothetical protein